MNIKTFPCAAILILTLFSFSQGFSQSTYYTGFDNSNEKAGWQEYKKGKTRPTGWTIGSGGVNGSDKLTHSVPTGDADKDSLVNWYVSPKFDFSKGGSIDSLKYNYFSFMNVFLAEQSLGVYLLVGSSDPANASSKKLLIDLTKNYTGNSSSWSDTGNISIDNTPGDCYIAFKLKGVDGWSSASFDNIYITQNNTNTQVSVETDEVKVYPNPASTEVRFELNSTLKHTIEVVDIGGKTLLNKTLDGNGVLDVSDLKNGTYIYRIYSYQTNTMMNGRFMVNR